MTYPLPKRCPREDREKQLILSAVAIIKDDGLAGVTRAKVACKANVSDGLVSAVFGTMQGLKDAIIEHAIEELMINNIDDEVMLKVLADGLVTGSKSAKRAPEDLKQLALSAIM